jgi:hypothetical protein
MIGTFYMTVSIIAVCKSAIYKQNHSLMSFLIVFDSLVAAALLVYNMWSWMIACSGLTTIEFVGRNTGYKMNAYDFTF